MSWILEKLVTMEGWSQSTDVVPLAKKRQDGGVVELQAYARQFVAMELKKEQKRVMILMERQMMDVVLFVW